MVSSSKLINSFILLEDDEKVVDHCTSCRD